MSKIERMSHGNFSPDAPETKWMTQKDAPDRLMTLMKDFWFEDPKGKKWLAPADYAMDGTSIPRALWTLVGSPFTGDYRRAAIVHDKACVDASGNRAARRLADKMFYHACREGGCSIYEASVLYIGVRIGAILPLLSARSGAEPSDRPRLYRTNEEKRIEADFQLVAEMVLKSEETDDPDQLENRTDAALRTFLVFDPASLQ